VSTNCFLDANGKPTGQENRDFWGGQDLGLRKDVFREKKENSLACGDGKKIKESD